MREMGVCGNRNVMVHTLRLILCSDPTCNKHESPEVGFVLTNGGRNYLCGDLAIGLVIAGRVRDIDQMGFRGVTHGRAKVRVSVT